MQTITIIFVEYNVRPLSYIFSILETQKTIELWSLKVWISNSWFNTKLLNIYKIHENPWEPTGKSEIYKLPWQWALCLKNCSIIILNCLFWTKVYKLRLTAFLLLSNICTLFSVAKKSLEISNLFDPLDPYMFPTYYSL